MNKMQTIDVRTSQKHRGKAFRILKEINSQKGSKFLRPSYSVMGYPYQNSSKPI